MYDQMMTFLRWLSGIMWGPWTLAFILISGFWLSVRTGWLQIFKWKAIWEHTFGVLKKDKGQPKKKKVPGEISPFQALATAMAACLGVGTIVGVATAISIGGPGAVFWMWFAGFLSIATKFSELTLAVHFRVKNDKDQWVGGPMFYIQQAFKGPLGRVLATVFTISLCIAAFGIGNLVQGNAVAGSLYSAFNIPWFITAGVLVALVALITFGGVKKIGAFAERGMPIAAAIIIGASLIGILLNIQAVPEAFGRIFRGAFTFQAGLGGFAGAGVMYAMRLGIARGIFSNEGGLGSAPIAHATAQTDHPVKQGLWGALEVFVDTHVVCTVVALVLLVSGMWIQTDAYGVGLTGAPMVIAAFNYVLPGESIGGMIVAVCIGLFGMTTMMGWSLYGEKGLEFLSGTKISVLYRLIWLVALPFGAAGHVATVWAFADVFNSFMLIPNILALLALSGLLAKLTKDFFAGKAYEPPTQEELK